MKKLWITLIMIVFIFSAFSFADEEARLLRFPAVYDNQVVFTYAGDLYLVEASGGVARKITNHIGYEMFPRFSPDGKHIAFTGQYDGNTEVYLIPSEGGVPKRLTYTALLGRDDVSDRMGPNNIVMGWKHDNKHIVFRSRMIEKNDFNGQLFLTSIEGEFPIQIPLPRSGFCSFSPDDSKLAFNRVFREFRTWKRYRGGMADDIWVYDFKTKKTINITNNPAQDIIPMWKGDKIYFLSDRDENKKMNLYFYDTSTKLTKKLTEFDEFDIKFPSLGKDKISFENGGYIYLFDTNTEKLNKVKVIIKDDLLGSRGLIKSVKKSVTSYDIAPDGKRALFGARGEIFTVPAKHGQTRNLTNSSGIHERNSVWSPDGKWIAYISDKSGENEIFIVAQDGSSKPIQLTKGADTYKYSIKWSPDSKKIMWSDKKLRLRYVDITTKKTIEVASSKLWEMRSFCWSPDSKWVAFVKPEVTEMAKLYLYSMDNQKSYPVTGDWYSASGPAFSSDGKYLFFVSERSYNPVYSWTEWNHIYQDMSKIYFVTLSKSTPSPFAPKSDEVTIKKTAAVSKKSSKKDKKAAKKVEKTVVVKVDIGGIGDRIIELPVKPSNYFNITSVKDKIYFQRRGSKDKKTVFLMYDLEKQKETELGNVRKYVISADNKKMLVSISEKYSIVDLPSSKISAKESLNLSGLEMKLCLKSEWKNIFNDSWRQMRDFFYAPNMHGVDWEGMKKRYEPLVKYVNHRNDLTYIIGEMIGELNVGHAYAGGGERPQFKKIDTGLLGAKLEKDAKTGYYLIKKILKGQNWDKSLVSPLTKVGVKVKEGDYIIKLNGHDTAKMKNIFKYLVNTSGKQVKLKVNSTPNAKGSWEIVIVPVKSELDLYYYNMVQENIRKVTKATEGKVGYVHIPDMGVGGLNEFIKHYYPQIRKKALIIDVRGNGGGSVSPMLIERLRRELVLVDVARNTITGTNPGGMILGPMVCLLDEFSASDGDLFPYRFKKHKLGKLIGKRSWGGVVGIRGPLPLLDGGQLFKPEFASFDTEGKKWAIEGYGVDPDIYVDNDPGKEFAGIDEQLNKAIEVILEELKTKERAMPPIPAYPDKSGKKEKKIK
jgi:tricorn protease